MKVSTLKKMLNKLPDGIEVSFKHDGSYLCLTEIQVKSEILAHEYDDDGDDLPKPEIEVTETQAVVVLD